LLGALRAFAVQLEYFGRYFLGATDKVQHGWHVAHHVAQAAFDLQFGGQHGGHRVNFAGQNGGDIVVGCGQCERRVWVRFSRGLVVDFSTGPMPEVQIEREPFLQIAFGFDEKEQVPSQFFASSR
jgi:hypothetical protein